MLLELFKYLTSFIQPKQNSRDITIVRRYKTPTGFVGEVYVDGKLHGSSCDNFMDGVELFRLPLEIGFETSQRVLRTEVYCISNGDFTAKIPFNYCFIGDNEPCLNRNRLKELIDKCIGYQYLRLTVLNRVWAEF